MDKLEEIARGNPAIKQILDSIFEQNKRLRERVGVLSRNYEALKIAYRKLEEDTKTNIKKLTSEKNVISQSGEEERQERQERTERVQIQPSTQVKKVKFGGERTKTFSKTDYIIPPS